MSSRPRIAHELTPGEVRRLAIVAILDAGGMLTTREVAGALPNCDHASANYHLERLRSAGAVKRDRCRLDDWWSLAHVTEVP